jgi:hypothetical protein
MKVHPGMLMKTNKSRFQESGAGVRIDDLPLPKTES